VFCGGSRRLGSEISAEVSRRPRVVFVQPFSMQGQSGGGTTKIFRSLLQDAPAEVKILVYGAQAAVSRASPEEIFVRERISLGRLERSRFASFCMSLRVATWQSSRRVFYRAMDLLKPEHVHLHLQGTAFIHGANWCLSRRVPFSASVHDDIRHLTTGDPWAKFIERKAAESWRCASNRFVISPEIGHEYSTRYGARAWVQITDGFLTFRSSTKPPTSDRCNVYFAGAVNLPYEPNLRALQQALKLLKSRLPELSPRFILRGGRHFAWEDPAAPPIEVRPFGAPEVVQEDLKDVDLLYLPLSIDPADTNFAKFSLSTKMITYLASGIPILYHGPRESAAFALLDSAKACAACFSNSPDEIHDCILAAKQRSESLAANALRLAQERFDLQSIRKSFWHAILQATPSETALVSAV
jgi:hypothetical protein